MIGWASVERLASAVRHDGGGWGRDRARSAGLMTNLRHVLSCAAVYDMRQAASLIPAQGRAAALAAAA